MVIFVRWKRHRLAVATQPPLRGPPYGLLGGSAALRALPQHMLPTVAIGPCRPTPPPTTLTNSIHALSLHQHHPRGPCHDQRVGGEKRPPRPLARGRPPERPPCRFGGPLFGGSLPQRAGVRGIFPTAPFGCGRPFLHASPHEGRPGTDPYWVRHGSAVYLTRHTLKPRRSRDSRILKTTTPPPNPRLLPDRSGEAIPATARGRGPAPAVPNDIAVAWSYGSRLRRREKSLRRRLVALRTSPHQPAGSLRTGGQTSAGSLLTGGGLRVAANFVPANPRLQFASAPRSSRGYRYKEKKSLPNLFSRGRLFF